MTTAPPATPTLPARLRDDHDFRLFFVGRSIDVLGATITAAALPLVVWQLTGSPGWTAAVTAVQVVPYLVFGLLAGVVADRTPRRRLMVACQVISGVVLITVPLASWAGVLTPGHALAVAAVVASVTVWFDAASFGALPALVGRDRIVAANSSLWTSATVIGVAGPALAGLAVLGLGAAGTLWIDALSFVAAAGCLLLVRRSLGPSERVGPRPTLRADIAEGLRFIRDHRLVRWLTLVGLGNSITTGGVAAVLIAYASSRLGLPDALIPGVWIVTAVGALAASLSLPTLNRRLPVGWITIGGLTVSLVSVLALAAVTHPAAAAVPLLLHSGAGVLVVINGIAARARATPDHLQARVNTTARMIAWGGTPVGALIAGVVAELVSVPAALAVVAVATAVSAVTAWRSPLRRRDLTDESEESPTA